VAVVSGGNIDLATFASLVNAGPAAPTLGNIRPSEGGAGPHES
jgi:hypothetical protein